jgi:uncharacterized protein YrrD
VDELGPPIAYVALEEGTPVYDASGERVGVVEHVQGDMNADVFDGLIVHTKPLPGKHLFADVGQIAELRERGVVLSVERGELHEPRERREAVGGQLEARVRRAWDWISRRD